MSIRMLIYPLAVGLLIAGVSRAAEEEAKSPSPAAMAAKAIEYLEQAQGPDGSFSPQAGPAITALVTTGILRSGRGPDDPLVAKSLKYLEKFVRADGGIYRDESTHQNYETAIAIQCFEAANSDGRYDELLAAADKYVRALQWDETENVDPSNFAYGGAGYGRNKRADLSNTSFLIDALVATGAEENDPALQKALVFVSRCQNLETEHNTTPHAAKVEDGGFYYTADAGGYSQAGETDNGGLRSYASMTYAGLKSMIYAGVDPDDPRVKAAVEWISKNYDLDSNPGMGTSGLYYYYHTFAKALSAMGTDTFTTADGTKHDWRQELLAELASRQQANGSWVNENERWMEADANLVTGYALLTLAYCKPESGK